MFKRSCLALFLVVNFAYSADPPPSAQQIGEKWPDAATVVAYEKLGAVCNRPERDELRLIWATEIRGIGTADRRLPVFSFKPPSDYELPKLPDVAVPFGISLNGQRWGRWVTDDDLKQLTVLKNLTYVDLNQQRITDRGLKELGGLRNLTWLDLSWNSITDAGMADLAGLQNLRYLNLWLTKVSDAGLPKLSGLKNLVYLKLGGEAITDKGMKHLSGLKNLAKLHLTTTGVTGAGLKELGGLDQLVVLDLNGSQGANDAQAKILAKQFPNLVMLDLGHSQVTDDGLREIAELKNLKILYHNCRVTDTGLRQLARLEKLVVLSLENCAVSDAGLKHLAGLKNLRGVYLGQHGSKNLTQAGIEELQKALPRCRISWTGAQ